MASEPPSVESLKRRQAVRVTLFLAAVAAGTIGLFHVIRRDVVAYRRGETALARGEYAYAATELGVAWDNGYRTPRARLDLARARLETGDTAGALPLFEEALADSPADQSLIETVAGLYQGINRPDRALALFERLGPPENLPTNLIEKLADIRLQAGDLPGAAEAYGSAVQRSPNDPDLRVQHGILLSWIGRRSEAIEEFRAALRIDPEMRQAQLHLARVLLWDGQFAESVTEFRQALPP